MAINALTETPEAIGAALAPADADMIVLVVQHHRERITELERALAKAHDQVCSKLCPCVWPTGQRPPHSQDCQDITRLLGRLPS